MTFKMMILGEGSLQLLFALMILLHMQISTGFNSTTGDDEVRCIERERQALLAFKQSLIDEDGRLSSWGSEEKKKDCCKWAGVQCSNTTGHITMLDLHVNDGFKLRGNLSSSLFELQHLTYLDLTSNDFNLSHIPQSIGSLDKLEYLYLSLCNLSGSLPSQLGNLTSLQYLDLGVNNFDSINNLEWLSSLSSLKSLSLREINLSKVNNWLQVVNKLPHLTDLYLRECNLLDVVPQSIPMINTSTSLAVLDLEGNNLTASAFQWLLNFSNSIVDLHLGQNQIEGGIPKSLGNLCKLKHLYLSHNNLEGMLPELIHNLSGCLQLSIEDLYLDHNKIKGPLPDLIQNFSSLRFLNLANNKLSGTLSKRIGLLSKLEYLYIPFNSFNGVISETHFLTLSKLRDLYMSFNPLSINFSSDWIPPFQLDYIRLGSCKLGPKFPSWLQTQRNFSFLDISGNGISDSIPKWFWNLSSRAVHVNLSSNQIHGILPNLSTKFSGSLAIDLSRNKLEGSLPVFPVNVTSINLSENKFSGSISSLGAVTGGNLKLLDVSHNQLSRKLPDCMTRWTSLVILNLANNHLFGKIPNSIGSLFLLETIGLGNNNFFGAIPWSLGNCSALKFLDLSNNSFSGKIPAWIGERLSSLTFLILRSNNFSGDIPLQLCWLTHIMLLDLSNNNLSGSIPRCIQNLTAFAEKESSARDHTFLASHIDNRYYPQSYADKASEIWKRNMYDYRNLKNLRMVDLSSNILTGEIPVQISVLLELVQLNLSRNQLTGSMPSDIGQLRQLESLDLSGNQLSGHLPASMSQLNFLSSLDLSYNNFSGRIPLSTQMQSFDASSFVGNPALCGLPLTSTCLGDEKSESKPIDSQEDGAEFWKSFKPSMELGVAIGFVGVLAGKLDHPWKHLCFQLFNYIRVRLCNLKDWLYFLAAALGLLVREQVSRLGRKLKLYEASVSS